MGGTPAKCWWSSTKAATSLTAPSPGSTPLRTDSSPPELPRPLGLLRASGSCRQQHEGLQGFTRPKCLRVVAGWWVVQGGAAIAGWEQTTFLLVLAEELPCSGVCQQAMLPSPDVQGQSITQSTFNQSLFWEVTGTHRSSKTRSEAVARSSTAPAHLIIGLEQRDRHAILPADEV